VRWIGAGFADQAVIACANAGTTLLIVILIDRDVAVAPLLAIVFAYFVVGINRAFVGEVFAALASRYDGAARERLVRDGLATAATVGLAAGAAFAALWAFWPHRGGYDLRALIWLAPFMPFVLVQDAGRYSHLAERAPAKALIIDLVWVGTQAVGVLGSLLVVDASAPALLMAWGCGATASAIVFLARTRPNLLRGDPRQWVSRTKHLSGWFTATALVGQFQTLAVSLLVVGRLPEKAYSGLRTAQTVFLQPVQNFQLAVQGLLVPRLSRLAGTAVDDEQLRRAVARLRSQVRRLALLFAGLGILMVAVVWPAAQVILGRIPKFEDLTPLALPISLQGAIYLVQVPFTAAMRATHRAKLLFCQYLVFTTVSLTGLVVGAEWGGLQGAVWGLVTGSASGLVVMMVFYTRVVAQLAATDSEPVVNSARVGG
jgi:hypothetical protein